MANYSSIKDLFQLLNSRCCYLVLRNWDNIFDENIYGNSHEDIDILCDDLDSFVQLTNAKRIHQRTDRDNFIVEVGELKVRFDVRYVGDDYYPTEWQKIMLQRRKQQGDLYVMSEEDYYYSLAYHALLQKPNLSLEYKEKLSSLFREDLSDEKLLTTLKAFLRENRFVIGVPKDPGVYVNWRLVNKIGYKSDFKRLINRMSFRLFSTVSYYLSQAFVKRS